MELSSQERRNEIVTKFWNPIEKTPRLEIGLSLCNYDEGLDREHLMNWTLTHDGTPLGGQDQRIEQTGEESGHTEVVSNSSSGVTSESPLRRPRKRVKSNHAIQQEMSISETIKEKLNCHKLIEDYTQKKIFEIVVFALKYKKDTSCLTLRNWLLDNLQFSGKRAIILINIGKTFGFEWNAYDLAINAVWQRKWEKALKLDNDRILGEIKGTGSIKKAVKLMYINIRNQEGSVKIERSEWVIDIENTMIRKHGKEKGTFHSWTEEDDINLKRSKLVVVRNAPKYNNSQPCNSFYFTIIVRIKNCKYEL